MKTGFLGMAGGVVGVAIVAVAFVLVPERLVSPVPIVALLLLAAAAAASFLMPRLLDVATGRHAGSDADVIATIGPWALLGPLVTVGAAIAFVLALTGLERLAIATDIVTVAVFVLGLISIGAARKVVTHAATTMSPASRHVEWAGRAGLLAAESTNVDVRRAVERLAESLRFAASDVPGRDWDAAALEAGLAGLEEAAGRNDVAAVTARCQEIISQLARREAVLRAARGG